MTAETVGTAPERVGTMLRNRPSVRRIVLHLPASFPRYHDWQRIAAELGAAPA